MDTKTEKNGPHFDVVLRLFRSFEFYISVLLAILIAGILGVAFIRIVVHSYFLIFSEIASPTNIVYDDFNDLFGKIMTLLITIEFMNSILSVLKSGELKGLAKNVTLITGLAIARKLIIFDYSQTDHMKIIAMAIVLIAVGIFYFFIKSESLSKDIK